MTWLFHSFFTYKKVITIISLFHKMYSNNEYVDMLLLYGETHKNAREAARVYRERFPNRAKFPNHKIIIAAEQRLRQTGSLIKKKVNVRGRPVRNQENATNILAAVAANPHVSSRRLSEDSGISQRSVLRILHDHKTNSTHITFTCIKTCMEMIS